jgi:uncharacterized protein with PQ loop repeat
MYQDTSATEIKIIRMKRRAGFLYGMIAGLAFAITLWGVDGYLLSQAHAYYPWIKFISGSAITILVGGLAGWLVTTIEKALVGLLIWFAAGGIFAWLTVLVPIVIAPALMGLLDPELQSLLHYGSYGNLSSMVGVSFAWIAIAIFIVAAIQIPMIEQSVFSVSILGKIVPHLICSLLMLSSGAILDNLHNLPLRQPIQSLDLTIQFTLNNRDREVDPKVARELHVAALRTVQDWLSEDRRLVVGQYDQLLENINVLVNFNGVWVECETIFGHPLYCQPISP